MVLPSVLRFPQMAFSRFGARKAIFATTGDRSPE
jgi:hypothetical protein